MTKLCNDCITLYTGAGFLIEPEQGIPESTGKCDGCKKKRWVKAVVMKRKGEKI